MPDVHAGHPMRVLHIQYANPAAYPPVEHGALLLAEAGCRVDVRGIGLLEQVRFARHPLISVSLLPAAPGGWRQKVLFARFLIGILAAVRRLRPDWLYVSDPLASPAAWCAARLWRVPWIYHEHDALEPDGPGVSSWMKLVARARRAVARGATLCVVPAKGRAETLASATGRSGAVVVWNTPLLRDVQSRRSEPDAQTTRLLFHGSIVPARVPETLLHALARLPQTVTLCLAGYDPSGGAYLDRLRDVSRLLGLGQRLDFRGTIASRHELMLHCAAFDVGLALLPLSSASINERTMLGASNKPFDYLACGLALLVSDLPDWRACFETPGYGRSCDPASVDSLVAAIGWLHEHPTERRLMGERGRDRVLSEWHYEKSFAPVLAALRAEAG